MAMCSLRPSNSVDGPASCRPILGVRGADRRERPAEFGGGLRASAAARTTAKSAGATGSTRPPWATRMTATRRRRWAGVTAGVLDTVALGRMDSTTAAPEYLAAKAGSARETQNPAIATGVHRKNQVIPRHPSSTRGLFDRRKVQGWARVSAYGTARASKAPTSEAEVDHPVGKGHDRGEACPHRRSEIGGGAPCYLGAHDTPSGCGGRAMICATLTLLWSTRLPVHAHLPDLAVTIRGTSRRTRFP